ncbi:MAG TPA: ThiF family adenylyltransferase [Frankiaceae bacterium]|nr:ThiF family adenylyltransferase [Frankiaceae bacterium]
MRPVLKPALRRLWRGDAAVQLGIDPAHGVVLSGVDATAHAVLGLMDGTRDTDEVVAAATSRGVEEGEVRRLVGLLESAHALDDAAVAPQGLAAAERERLDPDLAALSLLTPVPGGGARELDRRRAQRVLVVGAGRVGSLVAALLGAAGVGAVALRDELIASVADAVPGGLSPADDGKPRAVAAVAAAQRAGAASVTGSVRPPTAVDCHAADVAVLAVDWWLAPPPLVLDLFAGAGLPYVLAGVRETTGVVGPLVVPGETACPRCLDLHRADRDPQWPVVAAQLTTAARGGSPACDVTLAAAVAALTAGQVLAHLSAGAEARCLGATLELRLPDWTLRRRTWRTHPACACTAAVAAERTAAAERRAAVTARRPGAGEPAAAPAVAGVASAAGGR